ncbi:acyl-CoA dehydrogenase family protein [Rhodococcus jostii]|uniref:acyl-CoA dehydrogenase family protein n=1 Tax=Rhodococcus jostii TaxID=132919 RepID=UPI00364AC4C9
MTITPARHASGDSDASYGYELPWAFEPKHLRWQETVKRFAAEHVGPGASQRSRTASLDPDLVRRAAAMGMFGLLIEPRYGGKGADLRTLCLTIEELAVVDSSFAATVHVQSVCAALLQHLVKDRPDIGADILPGAASGETFISIALTEPSGGSDAGNVATAARQDGDSWVINGAKQFITNCGTPFSRYVIVTAAVGTSAEGHRPPLSVFLVPLDADGVTVGASYDKLAWRSSDTHPLQFDEVRVPASALLSEPGRGYREVLQFLSWARIAIAAMSAGLARGCLNDALRFVRDRTSFGKPLASHQAVSFDIAEIASLTATARTHAYDGAWKYDHGHSIKDTASVAKLVASEAANRAAYIANQLQGGYGSLEETAVARHFRDARVLTVGEGTSAVQRILIARSLGLPI